jgi:hypothetical protein
VFREVVIAVSSLDGFAISGISRSSCWRDLIELIINWDSIET